MVVVARPYNGFDPGLNLNLSTKLRDLDVVGIPMDFLPLDDPQYHTEAKSLLAVRPENPERGRNHPQFAVPVRHLYHQLRLRPGFVHPALFPRSDAGQAVPGNRD
jgi:hypothetical protein